MSDEGQNMQFPNLSIREGCWKCDGVLTDLTRLPNGLLVCERCHDELIGYKSRKNEILRANRKETVGRVRDVDMHNKEVPGCIADALTIIKKFDACLPWPFRTSLILTLMDLFEKEEEEDQ